MITDSVHGANLVDVVYGEVPAPGDPAEDFVEATKIRRDAMSWDAPGVRMLQTTPEMHPIIARAGQRHVSRARTELPAPMKVETSVADALDRRSSADGFADEELTLTELATLLRLAWEPRPGTGPASGTQPRRATPSAGALFPLEAGHLCQTLLLTASAMDLAARPLGGFCDDEVNGTLGFCGVDEVPLYLVPVGRGQ
ncbi:nitroreductase family protein [Dermacoccus sp. PAMC28757]|uniref:nitroreductase family protein n=1 Tax=Dermacoccus sp. PAMC28757 TaxID=2762331 RepID=UPI00164E3448|nr:nitroreductase family protein [Dermacoccus sp. PAMC28757]QNK53237.1 nitroreductase family protein [Dermacoccus sp. PAMC28757]